MRRPRDLAGRLRCRFTKMIDLENTGLCDLGHVIEDHHTIVLLGPASDFWEIFQKSDEWLAGVDDPIDQWSVRVISALAGEAGGKPYFPFGAPPYAPFLRWAVESGEAWPSPTGPLVHATHGMMVSYRGAIRLEGRFEREKPKNPCESCAEKPCISACPCGALSLNAAYDAEACKAFLQTLRGEDCKYQGCLARRLCPISMGAHRRAAQSAYHMSRFIS